MNERYGRLGVLHCHWGCVTECGSLQKRIFSGQADPISAREREQLDELRQAYIKRFGHDPEESG